VQGADGNLYGTTIFGGASDQGIVYRISPDGATFTILHAFAGGSDGAQPQGRLLPGTDGNFYGTASAGGGSANAGVVFRMTPAGVVTILHAFDGVD
jgi:uncharacterized repeat protein (TIGR03803 family)